MPLKGSNTNNVTACWHPYISTQ